MLRFAHFCLNNQDHTVEGEPTPTHFISVSKTDLSPGAVFFLVKATTGRSGIVATPENICQKHCRLVHAHFPPTPHLHHPRRHRWTPRRARWPRQRRHPSTRRRPRSRCRNSPWQTPRTGKRPPRGWAHAPSPPRHAPLWSHCLRPAGFSPWSPWSVAVSTWRGRLWRVGSPLWSKDKRLFLQSVVKICEYNLLMQVSYRERNITFLFPTKWCPTSTHRLNTKLRHQFMHVCHREKERESNACDQWQSCFCIPSYPSIFPQNIILRVSRQPQWINLVQDVCFGIRPSPCSLLVWVLTLSRVCGEMIP